jgi:protocatechuate 3,4-dioxygenase beta subunit
MRTFSRRLLLFAASTSVPLRQACADTPTVTPAQTEGPFYPKAFPADSDNDLVQVRGSSARAAGTVLHLEGRVFDPGGAPVPGRTTIEIWQCDAQGLYDHPRQSGIERRDAAFQGYGRTDIDASSHYAFRTLKPVAYTGRAPHIHLKVRTADGRRLTTQFYLAGDPLNPGDFVWREAVRGDVSRQAAIEMRLIPADALEIGAYRTWMDIVMPLTVGPQG